MVRHRSAWIALGLTVLLSFLGPLRPYLYRYVIDYPLAQKDLTKLYLAAAIILFLSLLYALLQNLQIRLSNRLALDLVLNLRKKLFRKTLQLPTAYIDKTPSGLLYTRLINDIQTLQTTFSDTLLTIGSEALQMVFLILLMAYTDGALTAMTLIMLPIAWWSMRFFQKRIHAAFSKIRYYAALLNAFLQESYWGKETITTLQAYPLAQKRFQELNSAYYRSYRKTITYFSIFFPTMEFLTTLTLTAIMAYGSWAILHHRVTAGTLVAFVFYLQLFFRPFRLLADQLNTLQMGLVSAERIRDILLHTPKEKTPPPMRHLPPAPYSIRLQNLTFGYQKNQKLFDHLNFTFEAGKFYVLSAPTGSGKTSLFYLLLGYYKPTAGEMYVADIPLRQWNKTQLRQKIGYVPQDPVLLKGTLRDNLTLYAPIPDKKLWNAADQLGILSWARSMGLDLPLQESGYNLSVGEKQLIALWRLYLRRPAILLLDEITAHIDTETEILLQQALMRFRGKATILAIAHRAYTLKVSDVNLFLASYALKPFSDHSDV